MKLIILYLIIINALSFFLMHLDKQKARKRKWRIPEATLLGIAALGGSLGCLLGMRTARHKTQKPKFSIGVPILLAIHALTLVFLWPWILLF